MRNPVSVLVSTLLKRKFVESIAVGLAVLIRNYEVRYDCVEQAWVWATCDVSWVPCVIALAGVAAAIFPPGPRASRMRDVYPHKVLCFN